MGSTESGRGWVANGQKRHNRFRRQQVQGGVKLLAGIIGSEFDGRIKVPKGVKSLL